MAKPLLKAEARLLRSQGKSIKEIAKLLKVSQSSVSTWCYDVTLTKEQIIKLEIQGKDPYYGNRLKYIQQQKKKKQLKIEALKAQGVLEVGTFSTREIFLSGIALYWAEGFKKDNQVGFANSDPHMIKFFLNWLETCFAYSKQDITIRISANINHQHRIADIQDFWANFLDIPTTEFQKPFFQKVQWKKSYDHPEEYFGVARIRVRKSTDFLRKINGYIDGMRNPVQINN